MLYYRLNLYVIFILILITGCRKFVEIPPPKTQLIGLSVYSDNLTAAAAVTGIYRDLSRSSILDGTTGISGILGLSTDEFELYPNQQSLYNQCYLNAFSASNPPIFWQGFYNYIYQANAAIEGLSKSGGVAFALKQQLIGEAKFIRAFCHFYLFNIYGDIPIMTTTDYKVTSKATRRPGVEIYAQIIADLQDAQTALSEDYVLSNGAVATDRVRPNRSVATALLARVYLFKGDWAEAEIQSTSLIQDLRFQLKDNLNEVFLKNSTEAIWQLEPSNQGFNTGFGDFLQGLLYYSGPTVFAPLTLNNSMVDDFENDDLRKTSWTASIVGTDLIPYFYPYKYKLYYTGSAPQEYTNVLRLAEQYLIRAEARAQQSNLIGSEQDLNIIRARAGLPDITFSNQQEALNKIYHERRIELFAEFGFRWFDLKRTNTIDGVMPAIATEKGGSWETTDKLFPIPLGEIQFAPQLVQNPGYN